MTPSAPLANAPTRCVALAAGGTGGHMFPAQALARELLTRGVKVVLITDRRGSGFGPELAEVATYHISAAGVAGGDPLRKLLSLAKLGLGYLQARGALKRVKADAVVGFGGYASLPPCMAGAHLGLRVVIHEQNAVMGRANRAVAKRASAIATCFDKVAHLPTGLENRVSLTGNPVRSAIAALGTSPYALPGESGKIDLLVIGGSQGARVFNDLLPPALCALPDGIKARLRLAQQVRGADLEEMTASYRDCGIAAELQPFFEDMPERLRKAHLLISRSGASTIAELAAAGRPSVMVPFPFATDDHQHANAEAFAAAGGGWVMPQRELTPQSLSVLLTELLEDPARLAAAAQAARRFAKEGAAKRLADLVTGRRGDNGGAKPREDAA